MDRRDSVGLESTNSLLYGVVKPAVFATLPTGETGVLEQVKLSDIDPSTCFIMMSDDGNYYIGRLTFDDQEFCHQVCDLLKNHYGRLLLDIGTLDIPYVP